MKKLVIMFIILGLLMCKPNQETKDKKKVTVDAETIELKQDIKDQKKRSTFHFDYLGETPPDTMAVIFAKDLVSTGVDESSFEINKQGDEIIFAREGKIMIMEKRGSEWSQPTVAPFSGNGIDGECCFSPDGEKIFFASRRNLPGAKGSLNTWISEKENGNWSDPSPLKSPFFEQTTHAVSVAGSGNIYCSGLSVFYRSDNGYSSISELNGGMKGSHPYIAPDESYIIFARPAHGRRDPDLHISFRKNDIWTDPVHLNDNINTSHIESNPFVTPDGKFLFFIRKYDVYWVRFCLSEYQ